MHAWRAWRSTGAQGNPQAPVFAWPFVVLAATGDASLTSRLLGSKPLHCLGVISYSIYMTHYVIMDMFRIKFGSIDTWQPAIYGLLAATAVVVSIGAHFAFEIPARAAIRRFGRAR